MMNQLAWTSFFAQLSEKMHTLQHLYLQQQWSQETALAWKPIFELFQNVLKKISFEPSSLEVHSFDYAKEVLMLLNNIAEGNTNTIPLDKRFNSPIWRENPIYRWLHEHYLIICKQFKKQLLLLKGLDKQTERKLLFYIQHFLDAISPAHFVATNPEILQSTFESQGDNILKGLDLFIEDLIQSKGKFEIKKTNFSAFKLGKNIASTPGKVIFQNELMQLIQYEPTTKKVYQTPLLIISPWINKYYILDLNPEQSLVRWLVKKGYTVFMISWVNPDAQFAHKKFEDYLLEGPIAALHAIEQATGETQVNAVGQCIGGTLLACTLSYLEKRKQKNILSATYLTTLLDFSEPGELGVFIDEQQISAIEKVMEKQGYLDGHTMAHLFNSLRANDLIWPYYIKNYLHGSPPAPMDILFWNSDVTHLPKTMHQFYLRNMYLNNRLILPEGIQLANTPIHLKKIRIPIYFLSAERDHIAPWKSTYSGIKLHSGPVRFVLTGAGHIAGVINSPFKHKYYYYTHHEAYLHKTKQADTFLKRAQKNLGSWWTDWDQWLSKLSGEKRLARKPGAGKLPIIESAPGTYARRVNK